MSNGFSVGFVALKMGATEAQFDAAIALHPSAAEMLVTTCKKR